MSFITFLIFAYVMMGIIVLGELTSMYVAIHDEKRLKQYMAWAALWPYTLIMFAYCIITCGFRKKERADGETGKEAGGET